MSKTVLVTGGSGFIGSWCVVELLKRGYTVRTTIRSHAKEPAARALIASAVDPGDRLSFFAADLTSDEGWDAAVTGCDYVLHVASPLGANTPRNPDELIVPARDGTLRVLKAATRAGVERVVFTSSAATCRPPHDSGDSVSDETVWSDPAEPYLGAYPLSKTLAERAAWDFMATQQSSRTTLTTILPTAVLGPLLTAENLGSVQLLQRLMNGSMPGYPRLGFGIADVRDVADLHIRAMTAPEAAGQRFLAISEWLWMKEMAQIVRSDLGSRAKKVPTRQMPDFVLRLIAIFDRPIRFITPMLGRKHENTSAKAQRILGWQPRPVRETLVDCAESLIAKGAVG
jgi:nucleoside-diphosphate-sugar epimerase